MTESQYRANEERYLKLIAKVMGYAQPSIMNDICVLRSGSRYNPEYCTILRWELLEWYSKEICSRKNNGDPFMFTDIGWILLQSNSPLALILAALELIGADNAPN